MVLAKSNQTLFVVFQPAFVLEGPKSVVRDVVGGLRLKGKEFRVGLFLFLFYFVSSSLWFYFFVYLLVSLQ
jgi:hypothetical protein